MIADDLVKLERFSREFVRELDRETQRKALRGLALEFTRQVIRRTPVDTGRARAGWTAWIGSQGIPVHIGGSDPSEVSRGKRESGFRESFGGREQVIEIVNGVPYIVELEFGHSQQAPAGMVRVTIRGLAGEADRVGAEAIEDAIVESDRKAGFR